MIYKGGFKTIEQDYDFVSSIREIDLRGVSDYSIERLKRWAKKYSYVSLPYCGHEHDCCGCVSSYYIELLLSKDTAMIKRTINFNY